MKALIYHVDNVAYCSDRTVTRDEKLMVVVVHQRHPRLRPDEAARRQLVGRNQRRAVQERNKEALSTLRDGIWFLQSAYEKLSKSSKPYTLWRGIDKRLTQLSKHYAQNQKVCWPSFTSASKKQSVMMDFADRGGSLIKIEAVRYAEFAGLSMRPQEAERLLGMNTLFQVQDAIPSEQLAGFPGAESIPPDVDLIIVKQIPTPPFGILRLPPAPLLHQNVNKEAEIAARERMEGNRFNEADNPCELSLCRFEPGHEFVEQNPAQRLPSAPQAPFGRSNRRGAFTALTACAALLAIVLGIGLSHGPFGILRLPSVSPLPTKTAERLIRYLTPRPQSHAECWAGNAPTTSALNETATVKLQFLPHRPTHEGFTTSHVALMRGSPAAKLLDTMYDAGNITTSKGLTLFHAAALGGQSPHVLRQLIQRGCSPTAKDAHGYSVMHYAALGGSVDTMAFILANGGSMTDKNSDGYTVMMAAAEGGCVEAMKFILDNGGKMNDKDKDGGTVMMAAAHGGSLEAMEFALSNGGNMVDKRNDGGTAMMAAADGGSVEAMKFILNNGGRMTDKDNRGGTAMMTAAYGGSVEAMKFVLEHGGNMTDKSNDGSPVMMAAAHGGSLEAMEFALSNGGNMVDKRNDGGTAMMAAADGGSVEAMKFILNNGGNMADKTRDGLTVMMYAARGSVEAMKFALANGGNMTDKTPDGYTVMMYAARRGSVEAMKFALANGVNMADKTSEGYNRNDVRCLKEAPLMP